MTVKNQIKTDKYFPNKTDKNNIKENMLPQWTLTVLSPITISYILPNLHQIKPSQTDLGTKIKRALAKALANIIIL
jgi:hypothetical protein